MINIQLNARAKLSDSWNVWTKINKNKKTNANAIWRSFRRGASAMSV